MSYLDSAQEVVVDALCPSQEVTALGIAEHHCADPFFDAYGPAPVFYFVNSGIAFPFTLRQCSQGGRPPEDAGVRQVRDIVKAVAVVLVPVIC